MQVSFRASWCWTIHNDKGEECHEIEDLTVTGLATVEGGSVTDITIEDVLGDWAERVGVVWHHTDRELPSWMKPAAIEAAKADAADSGSLLWETISSDARAEAETIDSDEDADREDEL